MLLTMQGAMLRAYYVASNDNVTVQNGDIPPDHGTRLSTFGSFLAVLYASKCNEI